VYVRYSAKLTQTTKDPEKVSDGKGKARQDFKKDFIKVIMVEQKRAYRGTDDQIGNEGSDLTMRFKVGQKAEKMLHPSHQTLKNNSYQGGGRSGQSTHQTVAQSKNKIVCG